MALEGAPAAAREQVAAPWRKRARAWLRRAEEGDQQQEPPRKNQRVKAYQWLVALDASVAKSGCEGGLSHFVIGSGLSERPSPSTWPQLTIVLDRGSDGMAAVQYLMYGAACKANIVHVPDPHHDCWNIVRTVAKDVGLATFLVAKTICLNYRHGPWQDSRFFVVGQEAVAEYLQTSWPETCPIFQH